MARRAVWTALPVLGFAIAYALAILAGRATRVEGSEVSLIWPAAAVAVLWALHSRSLRPGLAAAHWSVLALVTFGATFHTGATVGLATWFVVVNVALAGVIVAVLGHHDQPVTLRDPTDLGRLVVAVAAGTIVAATLAVGYFAATGHDQLFDTFALFAVRNGVTALAGVAVALRLRSAQWSWSTPTGLRLAETCACVVVTVLVFGRVFWFNPGLPTAFAIMLPAMWISLRYSTTTSTLFLVAAGTSVVWPTLLDLGALKGIAPTEQALLAQGMVGCLTFVVLTLALFRDSRNALIAELRRLALHDPLTGLANRTLLLQSLEAQLVQPRVPPHAVGVIYLDLDGFKRVNDAWGHREGDLLLDEMASRISAAVRPSDLVARLGGDEFVVACSAISGVHELHELAERIRSRIAEPYGTSADAPFDRITASVGYALSGDDSTARSLIVAADRAMYDAKSAGRNQTAASRADLLRSR